jgi:hypothetical protein
MKKIAAIGRPLILSTTLFSSLCHYAVADSDHSSAQPDSHAPIAVMGDHMHKAGEFMFSYRFMDMQMSGNLQASDSISSDEIVSQVANPFANPPMYPPTVRVVPQDMSTKMHMLGFMYAPNDDITLMAMLSYVDRDMNLLTYHGASGTNILGRFSTKSSGIGDTQLALLYRLYDSETHHLHANIGWIIPTGSIEQSDEVLSPMNTRINLRLPYSMQLGSGSHQADIGLTYTGSVQQLSWGSQIKAKTPIDTNDEGYQLGKKYMLSGWGAYRLADTLSTSLRLTYNHSEEIDGFDSQITAPVTTANPDNYGVESVDIALGFNSVIANKHRIALEYQLPLDYRVNGVQMDMDNMLTLGYQLAF